MIARPANLLTGSACFAGAVLIGGLVLVSPPAAALAAFVPLLVVLSTSGRLVVAKTLCGALPWLVVFNDLTPALVKTFVAAAGVVALASLTAEHGKRTIQQAWVWGSCLFLGTTIFGLRSGIGAPELIQAAKYMIFPTGCFVLAAGPPTRELGALRQFVLVSAVGALLLHLAIIALGLGTGSSYYGRGEQLGFGRPHELALVACCVAAAGFTYVRTPGGQVAVVTIGTIAAVTTGTRTALTALAITGALAILLSRKRVRVVVAGVVAGAAATVSGATVVIVNRLLHSEQTGEFGQAATAGSGRGEIWASALHHYWQAGPFDWIFGTGLRSITRFSEQELGHAFVGHSDLVEVAVQLGVVGMFGLLLLWVVCFRRGSTWVLAVTAVFAVLNGVLEYSAALVIAFCLAYAGSATASRREPRVGYRSM